MTITVAHITPLVALIAGILILLVPRLLNYVVAIYLIIVALLGLTGLHHSIRCPAAAGPPICALASAPAAGIIRGGAHPSSWFHGHIDATPYSIEQKIHPSCVRPQGRGAPGGR